MPLSTSNSNPTGSHPRDLELPDPLDPMPMPERIVPEIPWQSALWLAVGIAVVFLVGWEIFIRSHGYQPSVNDSPDLWAQQRLKASAAQHVIIGSSRVRFDLDLDTIAMHTGKGKPIQLAVNGGSPRPALQDLAHDERFKGTLWIGVTPGLFFEKPGGPTLGKTTKWVKYAQRWTPSQRAGHNVAVQMETRLASLNREHWSLRIMLERIPMADRPKRVGPPRMPPLLSRHGMDRQDRMLPRLETDPEYQQYVQQIWMGLVGPHPKSGQPMFKPDEETLDAIMQEVLGALQKLEARGVEVVFLRAPSTGGFRENEREFWPREQFYDRLISESSRPGYHFEDYADLAEFTCPEWSHLSREDAVLFTQRLMKHMEPQSSSSTHE